VVRKSHYRQSRFEDAKDYRKIKELGKPERLRGSTLLFRIWQSLIWDPQ